MTTETSKPKKQKVQKRVDIFKVTAFGLTIDFTPKLNEALETFKDCASREKAIWKLHATGGVERVR